MTPQSSFMVVAPVRPDREAELRALLDSMNDAPGRLKAQGGLIPFAELETLHFARLFLVEDQTLEDVRHHGLEPRRYPLALAFAGDVDGEGDDFLKMAAARAGEGLRSLFSCCDGFYAGADLYEFMREHSTPSSANYVNWRGRTVRRVREEEALRQVLCRHARANADTLAGMSPREIHATLKKAVEADLAAGRLRLSPEAATPLPWTLRNLLHLVGVPLLLLLATPILAVAAVPLAFRLRRLEKTDPEVCPRPDPKAVAVLAGQEDHDVSNQFSAMGSLKPGFVRIAVTKLVLLLIDYTARHVYTRGRLARVRSIHFARWVFINDRQRIVFLSNYDGSHESYMDDFVNKVGFGLNVVFSNGIGYPRTRWLLKDGGHDERKFKNWQRRHQIPTQVFYKAYPGLTAVDLERNVRIREGFDAKALDERSAREWVALL